MRYYHIVNTGETTPDIGVGVVAEIAEFSNGQCAVCWLTKHGPMSVYATLDDVRSIWETNGTIRVVPTEKETDLLNE